MQQKRRRRLPWLENRGEVRQLRELVARNDLACPEELQRIETDQQRKVGEALDEVLVVALLRDQHLGQPERERGIGPRPDNDHLIRFWRSGAVLDRDHHDLCPLQPCLGEPVAVRHLGADPVHPPDDDEASVLGRREIKVHRLLACHHRVARREIRVPRIVVPAARSERVVGADLPNPRVKEGQRVAEAVVAEDAGRAQERHPASHLHCLGACALSGFDHRGVVPLLSEERLPGLATVCGGNVDERLGRDLEGLIPGDLHPLIGPALEELGRRPAIGSAREALLHPAEKASPYHRGFYPTVTVKPAHHREPLLADPWLPAVSGAVAVEIGRLAVAVGRLDPDDHAVPHVGLKQAVMSVVGSAEKGEFGVVAPDVPVDRFPLSVRVRGQRVFNSNWLQELAECLLHLVKGCRRRSKWD